jgi:5-methylcytosine-specific restriction endonuclease McrA
MKSLDSGHRNCAASGGKWIRPNKRMAIYVRDGLRCVYCGQNVENTALTLDHVVPQWLGGTNDAANLVTACRCCNSSKGTLSIRGFMAFLRAKGVDTAAIPRRIRRLTNKALNLKGKE